MIARISTDLLKRARWASRILVNAVLLGCLLAGCGQLRSLSSQPTLPPLVAVLATGSPNPSATLATEILPAVATRAPTTTETPAPLTDLQATQTRDAADIDAFIATQLAILELPTGTPTPCPAGRCTTPTLTRTPYRSRTPTLTSTPSPPIASLHIVKPGPQSKITSPIIMEATGLTGMNGTINVELIGEDGRPLYRQVVRASNIIDDFQTIVIEIKFQIPGVAEAARLQVSTEDDDGRPMAQTSVDLILLSIGEDQINPPDDGLAPLVIKEPKADALVSGGTLTVKGLVRPINATPLILELLTQEGKLVGSRQFSVDQAPDGRFVPFQVEIPYTVSQLRNVRMIIRQQGTRIPGTAILFSREVLLKP